MSLYVLLRQQNGHQVRDLPDPTGGRFDAAGGFDTVLDRLDDSFPMLSSVDPYAITVLNHTEIRQLEDELSRIPAHGLKPIEQRGLARLGALVSIGLKDPSITMEIVGD